MKGIFPALLLLVTAAAAWADTLPGFRVEFVAPAKGFCSALTADSHDVLYYATTRGDIFRLDGTDSAPVAHVTTRALGNSGLLGLTLLDDDTAVVHYTTPDITADVVSRIDLRTGVETVIHSFVCNFDDPSIGVNSEHHGGDVVIAGDGSVMVGIGDYAAPQIAPIPQWNGGKIFRLAPDGSVQQLGSGFRNPFGMVWDRTGNRLVVADNGDVADDEIDVVTTGGFYGWPYTAGNQPPVGGAIPPVYTFPNVVAPTGMAMLTGANSMLRRGVLLSAFVTNALYLIPDLDTRPMPDPIAIVERETPPIVDVTQTPSGGIYFTTGLAIYRLVVPQRGDCNGDGVVDFNDVAALDRELADGDPHPMLAAQSGFYKASWGCDVNGDGLISSADRAELWRLLTAKVRAVRRR